MRTDLSVLVIRLGEVQDTNENTPRISEPVAATKTHTHKQKKKKNRENQLVPRKLSFGGKTASRKKRQQESDSPASRKKQHVQESDSDDESIPAELGTWVQCEAKGCQKWRYLPDVHDPVDLPPHWVCFMNKDERYNSCDAPEQEYDESEHILTQYTLGSVVWAKIDGFPWWPAMVDTDPDSDMYCLITHEDIMAPTEYHVVFLDEAVTRSWVRKDRIQHLTVNHFSPGSMFMKGHKYKREMQVAVRRAELALHMSLQDRLNRFGFSACFRNIKTKWTKAEASTRKPQKRKPARKHGSASGAAASKKSRLVADRQQTEDSSDSDSCASNRSSQSSSPDDGDNDDSDDDDSQYEEANKKKRLVDRQKGKAKHDSHKGGRVVKGLPKSGGKTVEHKKAEKKGLDGSKSKKKFRAYVYSACVSHKVSSVKAQGHQRERKDYSTDSDSSHSVSSDEGCRKLTKAAKPLKKKFKSAESKSEEKKNTHKKSSLKSEGRKPEDSWKEGEKICKKNPSESDSDVDQLQKTQQPHKKKRLFKSEMAKKRDENLKKKKATASLEDKKIKTKPQKFVAPVKPEKSFPQKSSSDPTALIQAATSRGSDEEALHKPDHWGPEGSDPEMSAVPKQDQLPGPDQAADQRPTTTQENLTPHKSSPLNQDQFVPSMDMSHNDNSDEDDDKTAFMEDAADRKWKSGRGVEAQRRGKGRREEGDSDSDCLDLEEDLPIPSLEQVLQVPSKGASDRDSVMSDPLEMVED
ncbi:uncharacterized protein LOC143302113 isoform X2 [Babylonia areolata]|uniref:uncharacterized protein LOC143302113 isoform X2 n=1 Tax=Babylonia areolata TaxID=304850 RepID=UPI003FD0B9C4